MATAPKSVPKAVPKAPAPQEESAPAPQKKSRKKLLLLIIIGLLLAGGGGGAAWFFLGHESASGAPPKVKHEPPKPPVFVVMDPFTVNLLHETGEQYLQVALTLQVADQLQVDLIKLYMPIVRSRLLLLLSSKKASEILTEEGKRKLADEIVAQLKLPFVPNGEPQKVSSVFFTSFVIQ
jgi:flagellar protein FliL